MILIITRESLLHHSQSNTPTKPIFYHSSFINSSGMTKLGFCKSWSAPISLNVHGADPEPPKNTFYAINTHVPFFFYRSVKNRWKSPTRHLESFWRWKFFLGLWISSMEVLWYWCASEFTKAQFRHALTINKRTTIFYSNCAYILISPIAS